MKKFQPGTVFNEIYTSIIASEWFFDVDFLWRKVVHCNLELYSISPVSHAEELLTFEEDVIL